MNDYDIISFDLDDTLWPVKPVIDHAESTLYQWFGKKYPKVTKKYTQEDIRIFRKPILDEFEEMMHDLTFVRRQIILRMANSCDYPEDMVDEAMTIYKKARNAVTFYDDVLPSLEKLHKIFLLVAVTNGNADIERIGISQFFEHVFRSAELGIAKPNPGVFIAVSDFFQVKPERILHIGDDPVRDIQAAQYHGMETVWLNRENQKWPKDMQRPGHIVNNLFEFVDLLM